MKKTLTVHLQCKSMINDFLEIKVSSSWLLSKEKAIK